MSSIEDFQATWILESPRSIGKDIDLFDYVEAEIKEAKSKRKEKPSEVAPGLYKMVGERLFYWYEKNDTIELGAILERRHEALVVKTIAKNPTLKGSPPWASDLYQQILKDTGKNIRILSDTQQSEADFATWKRLLAQGCKISVYDDDEPGKTFATFKDASEMEAFFKYDSLRHESYQFILSEDDVHFEKVRASFSLRRMQELARIL